MKENPDHLAEIIRAAWPLINPAQRLLLLAQILGYDLLNRFERMEVRVLTAFAFLLNFFLLRASIPEHPLKPFFILATAFYSAALLLMVATWPTRRRPAHYVR